MKTAATTAAQLEEAGRRLDASYHASEGVRTHRFIREWAGQTTRPPVAAKGVMKERAPVYGKHRLDTLAEVCLPNGIFIPSRFKRIFVDDPAHGAPYLTGGSILQAEPLAGAKLLSYHHTANMEELALHERMILITCSGTIGNCVYVNANFKGAVGSPDLIRIMANPKNILSGYLYAWLSSPLARALIQQKTYGAVVPHIEAHHVVDLPVPRLDAATEQRIHELIERAAELRVEANRMLDRVSLQLTELVGPPPKALKAEELGFVTRRKDIARLTAFSNKPSIEAAREIICRSGNFAHLGDVTERIFHPFRMSMIYVGPDKGVPFLNLGDMMSNRYQTANYMSRLTPGYEGYLLKYGWTLISRDGTIGKVSFVGRYLEGAATNQHISRIAPDTTQVPPGYLYAFMASPYAQLQIDALIYGSVIQGVYEKDLATILIPLLDRNMMQSIGKTVEAAFENRSQANQLEDQTQQLLLRAFQTP